MSKKENSFNWIMLITSLATLLTAFATLSTVFEMQQQRIQSTKPVIKIIPKVEDFIIKNDVNFTDYMVSDKNIITLELKNFGNGPAFNVDFSWEVNSNSIQKYFIEHFKDNIIKDKIHISENGFCSNGFCKENYQLLPDFNTILVNDKKETTIILPPYYEMALKKSLSLHYLSKKKPLNSNFIYLSSFPSIKLDVEYKDIGEENIKKSFEIKNKCFILYDKTNRLYCDFKIIELK